MSCQINIQEGMLSYENYGEYFNIIFLGFGCFFAFIMTLLYYHGVFHKVEVKVTKPPFEKEIFVMYKFTQNYTASRYLLSEAQELAPQLNSFSIYHEDLYARKGVGSSVGVVLDDKMDEGLYRKLTHAGFKMAIFPNIDYAVVTSFPYKNQYSLSVAVYRTYPRLKLYIKVI
ncbi:UNVERIFIED_CONTAM: Testis-expressed protein [Trichonephila clavipes]